MADKEKFDKFVRDLKALCDNSGLDIFKIEADVHKVYIHYYFRDDDGNFVFGEDEKPKERIFMSFSKPPRIILPEVGR